MKDYLIENLSGMCRYGCKKERSRADYCSCCEAAERLKEAEIQKETLDCVAQELEAAEARLAKQDEVIATLRAERDGLRKCAALLRLSIAHRSHLTVSLSDIADRLEAAADVLAGQPDAAREDQP